MISACAVSSEETEEEVDASLDAEPVRSRVIAEALEARCRPGADFSVSVSASDELSPEPDSELDSSEPESESDSSWASCDGGGRCDGSRSMTG